MVKVKVAGALSIHHFAALKKWRRANFHSSRKPNHEFLITLSAD
jgi:hypothetical protein